jgi:hypothetical protein
MGQTKHEKAFVNYDKTYETNIIGLCGIVYFAIGLFFLIVVSFSLMWVLQNVMEGDAKETKDTNNPMMMSQQERLPPEPRLQAAPGFGVEGEKGRLNLELSAPQAEYRALEDEWRNLTDEGRKDEKTGTIVSLPIEEAKRKFLEENTADAAAANTDGQKVLDESRSIVSYSSAGRMASDKRR